jgi:hypothetical protein
MKAWITPIAALAALLLIGVWLCRGTVAYGNGSGAYCDTDTRCSETKCPTIINGPDEPPTGSTMAQCAAGTYWSTIDQGYKCTANSGGKCYPTNFGMCATGFPCTMQWIVCTCDGDGYWDCQPVWSDSSAQLPSRYSDLACHN